MKRVSTKTKPKLSSTFKCPFCYHDNAVECKLCESTAPLARTRTVCRCSCARTGIERHK